MITLQHKLKSFLSLLIIAYSFIGYGQSEQLTSTIIKQLQTIDNHIDSKEFTQAIVKLEQLEKYDEYIKKDENRLLINLKRSQAFYGSGNQERAMDLLLKGLDELNILDKPLVKIKYTIYLGEIFKKSKDYSRSLDYLRKSLNIANFLKDTANILDLYLKMGVVFSSKQQNDSTEIKNDLDSATYYFNRIINYPVNRQTGAFISKSYNNLSALALRKKNLELSEEYGEKSLLIEEEQNNKIGIAYALINLSGIKYQKGEYDEARRNYLKAYNSISGLESKKIISLKENLLYNLSYVSEELKDFEKAYSYLLDATELTDSLSNANRIRNLSEIEAKFNVEKVEKAAAAAAAAAKEKRQRTQFFFYAAIFAFISLLVLSYIFYRNYRLKQELEVDKLINDSQIKIINATIDAKEMERKSIAEILHDSVSALLSSANLHLQATKAQLKTGYPQEITKAQTIVNEASVKIRDLSHELISSVLLKFGLAFAVHDMCQKYSNSEISLFSDDDGVKRYEQDFEIKIHSIIEELVNNILKHSKAKNASIMLAHRENNMLSIRMNDDGVGFDAKKAKTKGGLGLSHIEARITVMKGVFNIVSSKDNGTSIFILVPIVPIA